MEAEWLAEAIASVNPRVVLGLGLEFQSNPDVSAVLPTRDAILKFNGANSWRYALLTSSAEDFLYYKDEGNRFYLLCGSQSFLSQAHRCSWNTARMMFFDWVELDHHSDAERQFLARVWEKYEKFHPL
jgi:hypothetical protein